jgi:hypothetical protein
MVWQWQYFFSLGTPLNGSLATMYGPKEFNQSQPERLLRNHGQLVNEIAVSTPVT